MVENKVDLLPAEEQDNISALKEFADKNEFAGCFRASAKTGKNINESMVFLIQAIIDRLEGATNEGKEDAFTTKRNNVTLNEENHTKTKGKKKKEGCC
ncbi:MAG: hypothetical protein MJ252_07240 [archaeon]|nr:hypothetical protein [archaeon]